MKLKNKVAIITGATSGMGEACAYKFASEGAKIVIAGRNEIKGIQISNDINSKFGKDASIFLKVDISLEEDAKYLINKTVDKYKKIDILFNNAGVMLPSMEIEKMSLDDWKETFDINVAGYFLVTKFAKPYLLRSKGIILNNASIAGMQSYSVGRSYAYSASKAAIIQFSHQMAKNYAEEGVRVNCICPGIINTPILHGRDTKIYEDRIPLKRLGTVEDVAKVALFLVCDDSDYLTGVVIPIDGGVSL